MKFFRKLTGDKPYPMGVIKYTALPKKQLEDFLKYAVTPHGFVNTDIAPIRMTADAGISIKFAGYFIQVAEYETYDGTRLRPIDFPGDAEPPCSGDGDECCDTEWCDPTLKVAPSCNTTGNFSGACLQDNDIILENFNSGTIQLETCDGADPVIF